MIIKVHNPNYFSVVKDKFFSGKRLVRSCRACAVEELDFFSRQYSQNKDFGFENAFNLMEKILPETERREGNLFYKFSTKISNKFMEKIRRVFYDSSSLDKTAELVVPESCSMKKISNMHSDDIISHNRDLIRNIIGTSTASSFLHMNKYRKLLSGSYLCNLFSQKSKIINIFAKYLSKSRGNYDFVYTKDEIKYLRNLAVKYDAINNLMEENGIRTKEIETLLFSNIKPLSKGMLLPNNDVIISKTSVFDKQSGGQKPAIITFANTNLGYRFKLYRSIEGLIEKKDKIKKQFYYFLKTDNTKAINNLNKKIANEISSTGIAEVFVDVNTRATMLKKMEEGGLSKDIIESTLIDDEKFYYLHNLRNFNPQRYFNVSKILILELKKFGNVNNIKTAIIEALAYANVKHSPVGLYLRAGCIPLSETREKIEKQIYKNPSGFDYKKNVWLKYNIYDRIKSLSERGVL